MATRHSQTAVKTRGIKFIDLAGKYEPLTQAFHEDLDRVLSSGNFVLGEELQKFEAAIVDFTGAKNAVGVGNGTDALILCLKAAGVGRGDEVITTPMSYLASTSSITLCGATAVFVDIDRSLNMDPSKISAAVTSKTKAILPVHVAGIPARISEIGEIAKQHELPVIEDCAQALGATMGGSFVGTSSEFGAVSFHPLKNLGALGDGGMILAKSGRDAEWLRQARNHGHRSRNECDFWSVNSRLDELQSAFLRTQLAFLPQELDRRRNLAKIYREELSGIVRFPEVSKTSRPSYNWVMILATDRDNLADFLMNRGIEAKIHYPILIPSLRAAAEGCRVQGTLDTANTLVGEILSLPNAEHVTESDAALVCQSIKAFYQ